MKLLVTFLLAVAIAGFGNCSKVQAQPVCPSAGCVSPNLVYMTTNPWQGPAGTSPGSWSSNFTTTTGNGGGVSGGNQPAYNETTGTFMFGYSQATIAYTYALSTALKNSGMTWIGYNYSWDYINQDYTRGTLSANLGFTGVNGSSLYSKTWTLGPTTNGWTNMSGTETFTTGAPASTVANFKLSFTGKDDRFWAGYYGPQVKNPSLTINYTFDACSSDPLSSPTCPGYAAAYLTQQCTANPLYNSSCPGYATAYHDQQCSISPLSFSDCPGYAKAYLTYQCSQNPLYSTTCPGYEQAYFDQQCQKDGLYSTKCSNYSSAYATKQLLNQQTTTTTTTTQPSPTSTTVSTAAPSTSVGSDGAVSTTVSRTGDTNVDKAIASPTTSTNAAAAPAAPVQLTGGSQPANQQSQQPQQQEKRDGPSTQTASQQGQGPVQGQNERGGPGEQKTARQEIAERRAEAAKKDAVEKGKNLANDMGKASSMEQQVAVQNVVIQAMGFTPGFDNYFKGFVPDGQMYRPFSVYNNQKTVDNARVGRALFGGTDRVHTEMVESQYQLGK